MTLKELDAILARHQLWLKNELRKLAAFADRSQIAADRGSHADAAYTDETW